MVFGDASDLDRQGPAHCLLNFLLFLKEELLELFEIHLVLRFILVIVRKVVSLHSEKIALEECPRFGVLASCPSFASL